MLLPPSSPLLPPLPLLLLLQANVDVFRRCMPVAIRTANFLSGGQSLEDAAARLSVMNQLKGNFPVNLSFSWSAALQVRRNLRGSGF